MPSLITALEIFSNPADLDIKVFEIEGKFGFAISRSEGHHHKPMVHSVAQWETWEEVIKFVGEFLIEVCQFLQNELRDEKSLPSHLLCPQGGPVDQARVLNPGLINRILEQLRHYRTADTYKMAKGESEMPAAEVKGIIRIIRIPDGELPIAIRQSLVGLALPCEPYLGFADDDECGAVSGKPVPKRCGFSVRQVELMAILERERPEAFRWMQEQGFPQSGKYFGFAEDEAVVVHNVTRQQLIQVTSEMQGDPNR
jgi:hypothetical protein